VPKDRGRTRSVVRHGRADICVVGGAGHVGLPLAIVFASRGHRVIVYDLDLPALQLISRGIMPFVDYGAEPLLREVLAKGFLSLSSDVSDLAHVATLIVTIAIPVDQSLSPYLERLGQCFEPMLPYLSNDQLVILRSTVYPGLTDRLATYLRSRGHCPHVAFCPERIMQGHAIEELQKLPQIVSGTTPEAEERAAELFIHIAPRVIRLRPMEAEFAKLFSNAHRYARFAITNQFYMMANSAGLDYYRILHGMTEEYPRINDLPNAGFAAGPCLLTDTMRLRALSDDGFSLGHAAMQINEGLPLYLVSRIARKYDLSRLTIGLLGMAFKADSDDPRSSLSYTLKSALSLRAKRVLTTDPMVKDDPDLLPLEEVLSKSDLLILGVPHSAYRRLDVTGKAIVDVWNFFGRGGLI
jgi:UDP-N-acetyl-D-mannosaminuronic acid dehydrogenase